MKRFYLRDLFWLTMAVAVGLGSWLVGYRSGCNDGRTEVNRALQRFGKYAIFRIDDNGQHFVFDNGEWVLIPDPPAPPPPAPPPPPQLNLYRPERSAVSSLHGDTSWPYRVMTTDGDWISSDQISAPPPAGSVSELFEQLRNIHEVRP